MNVGKKFGRVKQWAGEKMGQESKTEVSDEFKSLEMEMQLRHEAMGTANDRISRQQDAYVHEATSTWLESLERSLASNEGIPGCPKEARTKTIGLRCLPFQDAKGKERRFQSRGRA
ncbi:hypothetical protein DID88_009881 [Monilinia fructigena]|uniref:BAR domain-containing protein n=1 Tax=Monilinia fructigena TaxID=38457 RepID=A0A395IKU0_9HELO|nr:hypothetical protein DID88_009881 [Monilinia fructigena]